MNTFNFRGLASIEHLNIRKVEARNGGAESVAVDIKLTGECDGPQVLQALLGAESESSVLMAFWDVANESHPLLFTGFSECKSWAQYEGHHNLEIGGYHMRAEKVGKFVFVPRDERKIDLTWSVTISDPSSALLTRLAESVKEQIQVELLADPVLLDAA